MAPRTNTDIGIPETAITTCYDHDCPGCGFPELGRYFTQFPPQPGDTILQFCRHCDYQESGTVKAPKSALSRSDQSFLNHLVFRQANATDQPNWVYPEARGRWRLVVWTMMGTYERAPFAKNAGTLDRLEDAGYISKGEMQVLPTPYAHHQGHTIALTHAGYAVLDVEVPLHRRGAK